MKATAERSDGGFFWFRWIALLTLASPAFGQTPSRPGLVIRDAGMLRTFQLARDEVYVRGPAEPRIHQLPAALATDEELVAYARRLERETGEATDLILYEEGVERNAYTRRILSRQVLVELEPGVHPETLAAETGASGLQVLDYAPGYVLLFVREAGEALVLAAALRGRPGIRSAEPVLARLHKKKGGPNDPLFPLQWHLLNTGQGGGTPGIDSNVTNVWDLYRGTGLLIGIVDDGLQYAHPDLAPNVNTNFGRNWNGAPGGPTDPQPNLDYDDHGTACAGVAAARGHNGLGVAGAAPEAALAGLRLIATAVTDAQEAEALLFSNAHIQIKSNSWGPADDGKTLEGPGPLALAAFSNGVTQGRGGRGTIYVWAGGNGLANGDDANFDGYANSRFTISVAALADNGQQSWYSEPGACHVVTAPSSGGSSGIVTTDLLGNDGYNTSSSSGDLTDRDYTKLFGGTSAAAPLVAGVIGLMLQANTNLGWRDVQEILIRSATRNHAADPGWRTNSAGLRFSHKYGAGLVNARAAVELAQTWTNLGPATVRSLINTNLNLAIPDNNTNGVSWTFTVSDTNLLRLEHVTLTVNITHPRRGQLVISLRSPSGLSSLLAGKRSSDTGSHYTNWTFLSVHHWGESSTGTWTVTVSDQAAGKTGTWKAGRVTFYGTPVAASPGQPPLLDPIGPQSGPRDHLLSFEVRASDPADGDLIRLYASNVPPWATFAAVTNLGGVTNLFQGLPSSTGTWSVTFYASDKDGTASEPVEVFIHRPVTTNTITLLSAPFDDGRPPGWTVTADGDPSAYWRFDNPGGRTNETGGGGPFAIADSDEAGDVNMDTSLFTPAFNAISCSKVLLNFKTDFFFHPDGDNETADVEVSSNGLVGPWSNVWRRTDDDRGPNSQDVDLSEWAAGRSNIVVRFRYSNARQERWWQVDDVVLQGLEIDTDEDTLADAWETHFFGDLTVSDAASDFDGDGFPDLNEFLAGTDPRDATSRLYLEPPDATSTDGIRLRWSSAERRRYALYRATNLPDFVEIEHTITATPPENVYLDEEALHEGPRFYRLRLTP